MIHNDVVRDHATVGKLNSSSYEESLNEDTSLEGSVRKARKLQHQKQKAQNRKFAKSDPYQALSPHDQHQAICWDTLYMTVNKVFHLVNLALEMVDPEFAECSHKLFNTLKNDIDKYGHHLARSESYFPGAAFHFNADATLNENPRFDSNGVEEPRKSSWHEDERSTYTGSCQF